MIIIVAAGSPRHEERAAARRMDRSRQFSDALAYAHTRTSANRILIFSAKYGLLGLNDVVEPATLRLGEAGSVTTEIIAAQAQQLLFLPQQEAVEVVGSAKVRSFLANIFNISAPPTEVSVELAGTTVSELAPGKSREFG